MEGGEVSAAQTAITTMISGAADEAVSTITAVIPVVAPLLAISAAVYFGLKYWRKMRGGTN